ncbi:MAG: DoxX family protein [Vulcanimicrobiota bacterium]
MSTTTYSEKPATVTTAKPVVYVPAVGGWVSTVPAIGRVLLSLIFVFSGLGKIFNLGSTAEMMASAGFVAVPVFLLGAIVLELGGGLMLMFDLKGHVAAIMLTIFLIPATLIFHDFWNLQGAAAHTQMVNFMKNVAILGGLMVAGTHSWVKRQV